MKLPTRGGEREKIAKEMERKEMKRSQQQLSVVVQEDDNDEKIFSSQKLKRDNKKKGGRDSYSHTHSRDQLSSSSPQEIFLCSRKKSKKYPKCRTKGKVHYSLEEKVMYRGERTPKEVKISH